MFFFHSHSLPLTLHQGLSKPSTPARRKVTGKSLFFPFFYLWLRFCLKCWCYFCIEIMMLDKCIEDVLTNMSFFFYFSLWLCLKCWYYFCIEIMMFNKCIKEVITNISLKKNMSLWFCLKCWCCFCIKIIMVDKCIQEVIKNMILFK